jgi:hypothetical protein
MGRERILFLLRKYRTYLIIVIGASVLTTLGFCPPPRLERLTPWLAVFRFVWVGVCPPLFALSLEPASGYISRFAAVSITCPIYFAVIFSPLLGISHYRYRKQNQLSLTRRDKYLLTACVIAQVLIIILVILGPLIVFYLFLLALGRSPGS